MGLLMQKKSKLGAGNEHPASKKIDKQLQEQLQAQFQLSQRQSTLKKLIDQAKQLIKTDELPLNYLILDTFAQMSEHEKSSLDSSMLHLLQSNKHKKEDLAKDLKLLMEGQAQLQKRQLGEELNSEFFGWCMPGMTQNQIQKQGLLNSYLELSSKCQLPAPVRQQIRKRYSQF